MPATVPGTEATPLSMAARIYDTLRMRLIAGRIIPGAAFSTRGLARELEVSQTPVRDALARLAAEGAVESRSKRRITVPEMTRIRYDDLTRCRLLLEPTVIRLLPAIDSALGNGDVDT